MNKIDIDSEELKARDRKDWKDARDHRTESARFLSQLDGIAQALAELGCPAPEVIGQGHLEWLPITADHTARTCDAEGRRRYTAYGPILKYDPTRNVPRNIASVHVNQQRASFGFQVRRVRSDAAAHPNEPRYIPTPVNNMIWEAQPSAEFLRAFAQEVAAARKEWAEPEALAAYLQVFETER